MARAVDGDGDGLGLRRLRRRSLVISGVGLLVAGAGIAVALLSPSRAGHHRSVLRAIIVFGLYGVITVVRAVVGWRRLARDEPMRRLMRVDRPTRRRVGTALRKGLPIPADDRATALALIDLVRRSRWWLFPGLAAVFLILAASAPGSLRWYSLAMAGVMVVQLPFYLRQTKRILSREAEMATPDPPQEQASAVRT